MRALLPSFVAAVIVAALASAASAQPPTQVAVFDFELIEYAALGPPDAPEAERLAVLAERLRDVFRDTDGFAVVTIAPVAEAAARRNLQACGGCDVTFARELGADWSVTGTVQKVSNLILNINLYVKDTASGELVQAMSADIRSNTDEAWRRGLDWLVRNRLDLTPPG